MFPKLHKRLITVTTGKVIEVFADLGEVIRKENSIKSYLMVWWQ